MICHPSSHPGTASEDEEEEHIVPFEDSFHPSSQEAISSVVSFQVLTGEPEGQEEPATFKQFLPTEPLIVPPEIIPPVINPPSIEPPETEAEVMVPFFITAEPEREIPVILTSPFSTVPPEMEMDVFEELKLPPLIVPPEIVTGKLEARIFPPLTLPPVMIKKLGSEPIDAESCPPEIVPFLTIALLIEPPEIVPFSTVVSTIFPPVILPPRTEPPATRPPEIEL